MDSHTNKSILDINIKKIAEVTTKNIQNVITNTVNSNSIIVISQNNIKFQHVKISGAKGKIEINQKNSNCLIIDEQFNNDMNTNISKTYVSSFYNEIIESVNEETLNSINEILTDFLNNSGNDTKTDNVIFDINNYINIENKLYVNIIQKIHNIISNSKLTETINSCITKVQQYNYIGVNDVEFGSSEYMNESDYKKRKTKINVLFNQENTTDMLIKCIASTEEITTNLTNVINELSNYESHEIHKDIDKKDKDLDNKDKILDKKITNKKKLNTQQIILIVIVCVIFLMIIVITIIFVIKNKKSKDTDIIDNDNK